MLFREPSLVGDLGLGSQAADQGPEAGAATGRGAEEGMLPGQPGTPAGIDGGAHQAPVGCCVEPHTREERGWRGWLILGQEEKQEGDDANINKTT